MAYTCPHCRRTSQHPDDERNRYCPACHQFEINGVFILNEGTVDELVNQFAERLYGISPTAAETPPDLPASGPDQQP